MIEHIPDVVLNRPRGPVGGYVFGYLAYQPGDAATLGDLVEDYVGHLHHHFKQIHNVLRAG